MYLARDILDKQLMDVHNQRCGKADGVIIQLRKNAPPKVVGIEVGPVVLARRLQPRFGDWLQRLESRLGVRDETCRIPLSKIHIGRKELKLDLDSKATTLMAWEKWICDHVIGKIPGA